MMKCMIHFAETLLFLKYVACFQRLPKATHRHCATLVSGCQITSETPQIFSVFFEELAQLSFKLYALFDVMFSVLGKMANNDKVWSCHLCVQNICLLENIIVFFYFRVQSKHSSKHYLYSPDFGSSFISFQQTDSHREIAPSIKIFLCRGLVNFVRWKYIFFICHFLLSTCK